MHELDASAIIDKIVSMLGKQGLDVSVLLSAMMVRQ